MSVKRQLEERAHWLAPEELIAQLDPDRGMTVAEIAADPGYYSAAIARQVGPQGRVFAVGAEETELPGASCDLVVIADILNRFGDRRPTLAEAKRILKPGGRISISDVLRSGEIPDELKNNPAAYTG